MARRTRSARFSSGMKPSYSHTPRRHPFEANALIDSETVLMLGEGVGFSDIYATEHTPATDSLGAKAIQCHRLDERAILRSYLRSQPLCDDLLSPPSLTLSVPAQHPNQNPPHAPEPQRHNGRDNENVHIPEQQIENENPHIHEQQRDDQ
ncbi:uncharacterized protein B0H18DRAFT_958837 [Fomitopsis serialis]|uniref:uncharacterized protein n=1 Tax=Fomitopsis serialis TaxID=139415 RepID=UPI002008CFDD|nr:uncharacterized protein B0H18DRAFT_958837 [Neoantrodia serialis]KAH9916489.1 hypothetical protein B0H18DRAFT_958837 [Neoantrodia serialis]